MNEDLLGYNAMVETAMRSVVRQALDKAAETGLPNDHHFYITFETTNPDVIIPDSLRKRYPEEMTIVLQHQFWALKTDDDGFSVELSFNNNSEYLRIPFAALITFADPSVNFGLQFHNDSDNDFEYSDGFDYEIGSPDDGIINDDASSNNKNTKENQKTSNKKTSGSEDNIVTLDSFRKK